MSIVKHALGYVLGRVLTWLFTLLAIFFLMMCFGGFPS